MPVPSDIGGTARVRAPHVIERATGTALVLPLALISGSTADSTCDVSLLNASGTLVESGTGAVGSGLATWDCPALADTVPFGKGYRTKWVITIDDVDQVFMVPAAVARQSLKCPIGPADLLGRHANLSTVSRVTPNYQGFIDEAWTTMLRHLMSVQVWPETIVDVDSLVDPVREHAMQLLFEDLALTGDAAKFGPLAQRARDDRKIAMAGITFRRDLGQTGGVGDDATRSSIPTVSRRSIPPTTPWGGFARTRRVL